MLQEERRQRNQALEGVWGLLCCSWTLWELANFICSPQPSEYSGCSSPPLCADSLGGMPWWAKTLGDVLQANFKKRRRRAEKLRKGGLDFPKNCTYQEPVLFFPPAIGWRLQTVFVTPGSKHFCNLPSLQMLALAAAFTPNVRVKTLTPRQPRLSQCMAYSLEGRL